MATLTGKPKPTAGEAPVRSVRAELPRYRLQVDRQTKDSFSSFDAAEKRGKELKKAYPVVQVAIYATEKNERIAIVS